VLSFTDALHAELKGAGVTATSLCPGPVRTEFAGEAGLGAAEAKLPEFVWTTSADVAEQGVQGLEKGKRVVVPGRLNAATAIGGQHAPRGVLLKLANRFYPV